jgi:hypothetical protein
MAETDRAQEGSDHGLLSYYESGICGRENVERTFGLLVRGNAGEVRQDNRTEGGNERASIGYLTTSHTQPPTRLSCPANRTDGWMPASAGDHDSGAAEPPPPSPHKESSRLSKSTASKILQLDGSGGGEQPTGVSSEGNHSLYFEASCDGSEIRELLRTGSPAMVSGSSTNIGPFCSSHESKKPETVGEPSSLSNMYHVHSGDHEQARCKLVRPGIEHSGTRLGDQSSTSYQVRFPTLGELECDVRVGVVSPSTVKTATARPVKSVYIGGVKDKTGDVDTVIVRENTEDLVSTFPCPGPP